MTQKLRNSIDNGGVLDKEYYIISKYQEKAREIVNRRRGLIKRFFKSIFLVLFPPMNIDSPRWDDKEVEEVYEVLMIKEGNKELYKLRPDLYASSTISEPSNKSHSP